MSELTKKAKEYANAYMTLPYGREINGTRELLMELALKLEEYEDSEQQKKLLILPFAVGETVYTLNPLPGGDVVIAETVLDEFMAALCLLEGRLGKTLFRTWEEANIARTMKAAKYKEYQVICENMKRLAMGVNSYFKGTVHPIWKKDMDGPCLLIQLPDYKPQVTLSMTVYRDKLKEDKAVTATILMDVLKSVEKAAAKIPTLKTDMYME